jgi:hypothetical protein
MLGGAAISLRLGNGLGLFAGHFFVQFIFVGSAVVVQTCTKTETQVRRVLAYFTLGGD